MFTATLIPQRLLDKLVTCELRSGLGLDGIQQGLSTRITLQQLDTFSGHNTSIRRQDDQLRDALDAEQLGNPTAVPAVGNCFPRHGREIFPELSLVVVGTYENHLDPLAAEEVVALGQQRREAAARTAPMGTEVERDKLRRLQDSNGGNRGATSQKLGAEAVKKRHFVE